MCKGNFLSTARRQFLLVFLFSLALFLAPNVGWGQKTYYSYKHGDWNTAGTWTLDPTGTTPVGADVPSSADNVVIRNGDIISISGYPRINIKSIEIESGATLDLGNTSGHTLGDVNGKGLLRISSTTLPSFGNGNFNSAGGGTVEVYADGDIEISSDVTYNNLVLNFVSSSDALIIGGGYDITFKVNGDLTLKRGGFVINGDYRYSSVLVSVLGNTYISSNSFISNTCSKNYGAVNNINFNGDFINEGGSAKFYSNSYWGDLNSYATVTFNNPSKNQLLQCNGNTKFWNLVVNKGVDDTYMLDVQANASGNFSIDGSFNSDVSNPDDPGNVVNNKALELLAGTLRLGNNVSLPSIAPNGKSFAIDSDAQLWLDGANVSTTDAQYPTRECVIVYGRLKITGSSNFSSPGSEGIIIRGAGIYEQSGGIATAGVLRTSARGNYGDHRGGVIMTGGKLTITGSVLAGQYAAFTLPYPNNIFQMSGDAVLDIQASTSTSGEGQNLSILLSLDPSNANLSGGTVIVCADSQNAGIVSKVPFYNLKLQSSSVYSRTISVSNYDGYTPSRSTDAPMQAVPLQPLVVKNDFSIEKISGSRFLTFNVQNQDLIVGGNMLVSSRAAYQPSTNTTRFNGAHEQTFTNNGVANLSNVELVGGGTYLTTKTNMQVNGNLTIGEGTTLYDEGKTVTVDENIYNSGKHVSTGNGSITMSGSGKAIGGSGNGIFGVLKLTGGSATLASNQRFDGSVSALRLVNGLLNIGSYRLTLGSSASVFSDNGTGTAFSATKMIKTGGLLSDEGVVKDYSGGTYSYPHTFTFPVGFASSYHPATLRLNIAPTKQGQVTVKPVSGAHPLADASKSLACYWKTSAANFVGLNADWAFKYIPTTDVKPAAASEKDYIGAVFRGDKWINDQSVVTVDKPNDSVTSTNQPQVDGEYSAGLDVAFSAPKIYYSILDKGDWDDPSTWSMSPGGSAGTTIPDASSVVVIGEGGNHIVTIPANLKDGVCKRLIIKEGSTLDVKIPTAKSPIRNFGYLADQSQGGGGTLKVELAYATVLPSGDFSDFCGTNGGTVEYYGSQSRTLPAPPHGTYYNLVLSPAISTRYSFLSGGNTIFNDLTCLGQNLTSEVATSTTTSSVTVGGSLFLKQGTFYFWNTGTHQLEVGKDVLVDAGANFRVTGGSGHSITIGENLRADGPFDARNATLIFKGDVSGNVSGSANVYIKDLVIDKGVSSSTKLSISNSKTTIDGSTTLLNGELLVNGGATFSINHPSGRGFIIPATAALTVDNPSANITVNSNAFGNDGDILLFGTLGVKQGNLYVGPATDNYNYDIEVGASGAPTIRVDGGNLFVGGQIRRSVAQFVGSLRYYQNGGTVNIQGKNQNDRPNYSLSTFKNNQRAKFEVLNAGSVFSMTGGTLRIAEGGGGNFGDFYVEPESATVTGGVVELGSSSSNYKDIRLSASCLMPSVVVGDGITAMNTIYPLQILNDLTINTEGIFKGNGLNLTIGRSLFCQKSNDGFQHGAAKGATQTTTFNSGVDGQIVGTLGRYIAFSTLVVNKPGAKLALGTSSDVRVEKLFDLSAGTFQDKGNTITVKGDMKNTAVHESDANAATGVVFEGTAAQRVWSDIKGVFGNVGINNDKGVTFDDEFTINNRLTFAAGNLNIDENLLRLGASADIQGASSSKYIMSNGIYRDKGVEKIFPKSAAAVTFVYPLGVPGGKYTPATITLSNNSRDGESVRILPINSEHPMLVDPTNKRENLDYYWIVEPSSNLSGYTTTMKFNYVSTKVFDVNTTKIGRFLGDNWNRLGGITKGAGINLAGKFFTVACPDSLRGEYTLAHADNLYGKPVYYSVKDGSWEDGKTWKVKKPEESTFVTPASGPNGHRVIINSGHTVTITQDSRQAYSLELNGKLDLGNKIYHDFRKLLGSGTLKLEALNGQFLPPGGDLTAFTNQSVSTIELNGEGILDARFTEFPNLIFTGAGEKVIPLSLNSRYHTVYGNLTIVDGVVKKLGSSNQGLLRLYGNWENKKGADAWVPGTSQVQLVGDRAQTVSIVNGATEQFYNLQLQKNLTSQKVTLNSSVDVTNLLSLNRGIMDVIAGKALRLTSTGAGYTRSGYAVADAFVDGVVQKNMLSGATFTFPVGDDDHSAPVSVENTSTSATPAYWETQYYKANPSTVGSLFDKTQLSGISDREYWRVRNTTSGVSDKAYVRLQWDDFSGMPNVSQSMNKIRVAEFNGTTWKSVSDGVNVDKTGKTVRSSDQRPNANVNRFYTLSLAGMPTAVLSSPVPADICGGESTSITLTMTGVGPWKIQYTVDGGTPVPLDVPSSPFTFALTGSNIGVAVDKDINHKVKVVYVKDNSGDENFISSNEVEVLVKRTPNPIITGPNPSMQGATGVKYKVNNVTGDSYSWSITGGVITAGKGTNEVSVTWNSVASGTVSITESGPSNSCPVTASMEVSLDTKPTPHITASPSSTSCVNSTVVYSTPSYKGNTYLWTIPGTLGTDYLIASGGVSNSLVEITWKTPGIRQLIIKETKGSTSVQDAMDIKVNSYPLSNKSVSDAAVCKGSAASITIQSSESGATYQLYDNTGTPVGGAVNGSGNDVTISPVINASKGVYTTYEVRASIGTCQMAQVDKPKIEVLDAVVATVVPDKGTDVCSSDLIAFTAFDNGVTPIGSVAFYHNNVLVPSEKVVGNIYKTKALANGDEIYAVIGNGACSNISPTVKMTVKQCIPNDPVNPPTVATPTVCASTDDEKMVTNVALDVLPLGATQLIWSLTAGSGTVTSTGLLSAKVEWAVGYVGTATISVVGSNASGSSANAKSVNVTVHDRPLVNIEQVSKPLDANPYTTCAGGTINLTVKESGYTYEWSVDSNRFTLTSKDQQKIGVISQTDLFDSISETLLSPNVKVIVTDSNGCMSSKAQELKVYRIPRTGPPYHIGNNISK